MHVFSSSDIAVTSPLSSISPKSGIRIFSTRNVIVRPPRLSDQMGYCEENDYGV
jgi:hypothetical protein